MDKLAKFIKLANDNEGFVGVVLFVIALFLGWISGIFESLRRKPKFKVKLIEGPTFCCTFETGREFNNNKTHVTAIALYLKVTNIGSAPSGIEKVEVGYHNHTFKHTYLWFWLKQQIVALTDFQVQIGDSLKVYPFLIQLNQLSPYKAENYLEIGKNTNGVAYFEQEESWGGFLPREKEGKVKVKISVEDAFGKRHTLKTFIPKMTLAEAQKFNPTFGQTMEALRNSRLNDEKVAIDAT